ncbi:MAG: YkoF family thiamine/hydroxymethylpyrimidine-binding protein [Nonlabens sp.]
MQVSVEITMSPLRDDYEQHIIDLIKVLRKSRFTVIENSLSTQIFGKYSDVLPFLTQAIEDSMSQQEAVVYFLKLVKTDRSDYKPHF